MDKVIVTNPLRCGYVNIAKPRVNDLNGTEEYSIQLLIPKGDVMATVINDKVAEMVKAKWGDKVPSSWRHPMRDADAEGKKEEHYKNHFFLNLRTTDKVGIVNSDGLPHANPEDCRSGDYYRVSMGVFAYDKPTNGVSFGLNNCQWCKKGESLTGRQRAEDEFGAVGDSADDLM